MKHFFEVIEDFIRANFDKLLLVGVMHSLIAFERWDMVNTVLGAIIMLTTGIVNRKNGNGNGGGSTTNTSTSTTIKSEEQTSK